MDWGAFIPQALGAAAGAMAAYMAIREDIATLKAQMVALAKDADDARIYAKEAHARIDAVMRRDSNK